MNKPAAIPGLTGSVRLLLARARHGRPLILAARLLAAFVLAAIVSHSGAGPAPVTSTLTGIVTWLAVTLPGDLAPPPGR